MAREGKVYVFDHPLIQHKVSLMRKTSTTVKEFRELATEVAMLMGFEATRDLALEDVEIETPVAKCVAKQLKGKQPAIVPILRAGIGMVDGMLNLLPQARVGHIGLYRDPETCKPVEYYCKLPDDIAEREVFVVDPMLATGGSAVDAVGQLKKLGYRRIKFLCLVSAPEGMDHFERNHPEVPVYAAAMDERLNSHFYIVPGLGDAGDRIFGTL